MILPHLEVLDLGDNEVSDLMPLRSLFKLRDFYGYRNKFSSLEGLPKGVEKVYVGGNQISCSSLKQLLFVDSFDMRVKLANLKVLDIVGNPIPSDNISIETLRLKGIDVKHNKRQGELGKETRIGVYEIEELISDEGIYHVYGASDTVKRPCAIKIKSMKRKELKGYRDSDMLSYFEELLALDHPNIIKFIHAGHTGSSIFGPYLVMESIDNSKYKRIDDGQKTYSPVEAASIVTQVASALAHMHEKGLELCFIGRDNILYDEKTGMVKLTDSAEDVLDNHLLKDHASGQGPYSMMSILPVALNAYYMFPWVAKSGEVLGNTQRDVKALGLLFYDLVTGFKRKRTDMPSDADIKKSGLSKDLTGILQNVVSSDEEKIPDAKTLLGQLRGKLGKQEPYKSFYPVQKEFEELLAFSDQGICLGSWPENVISVKRKWLELQKYVKQYKLEGYFHARLEKIDAAYRARKSADVKEAEFLKNHREAAIKKGLSPAKIDDVTQKVPWLWDMSNFLNRYSDREAALKDGVSKEEIDSRYKLYMKVFDK
jgi:serine/threonine protein kinase